MLNVKCHAEAKLRQINAKTGKVVSETGWTRNLLMTGGLQSLAQQSDVCSTASITNACRVGSGTTADKISSGAITFTQAGTTLTASAGFFTAGMVGYIFKWGSGSAGVEVYITAFTSSTIVTVGVAATVAVPEVGTVWNVTRIALETLLYTNTSYETTTGACGSSVTGGAVTHKRTYNFATQVASYNVNEVGYSNTSGGTNIKGRIVLAATEVVAPTNFLQVVLNFVVTYSPAAPTAVVDVGTNINTAGNAMLEAIVLTGGINGFARVNSNGGPSSAAFGNALDGSNPGTIIGINAAYTQNATPSPTTSLVNSYLVFESNAGPVYGGSIGLVTYSSNTTITTAGDTLYGVALQGNAGASFDVKFTSPYVTPVGSFLPRVVFGIQYGQSLTN